MNVICISGKAQHGKDTTAKILKGLLDDRYDTDKKVLIVSYAGLLKYICKTFFGWNGEKDAYGRTLLQYVGTEIIRAKDPDYWVRFVSDQMRFFEGEWPVVLIPDTRFPNEIEYLKEAGHTVTHLRIVRPNFDNGLTTEQQNHPSEIALDSYPVDYTILNDGTVEDLADTLGKWLEEVWPL